jgi:hypothetical protein
MSRLTPIKLEINAWNGFVFSIIGIETNGFEGELLGLHIGNKHLIFNMAFFHLEVTNPFTQ